jgi:hypothetical protein
VTYSSAVMADSPVGYWKLNESSGTTAADDSGNSRNGTYVNTPTLSVTSLLPATGGTAVSFAGGSSERVTVAHNSAFNLASTSAQFTFECWVKLDSPSSAALQIIADKSNLTSANGQWRVYWDNRNIGAGTVNNLRFFYRDNTVLDWSGSVPAAALAVGGHLACVIDSTHARIYWDGVQVTSVAKAFGSVSATTQPLTFGCRSDGAAFYLSGTLDEIAIYGTGLSSTRIAAHYDAAAVPTGTITATGPAGVAALSGTVTSTGTVAATGPAGVAALAGTVTTTGTLGATGPAGVADLAGTVDGTTAGILAATGPAGVASLVGTVTTTGTLAATGPAGIAAAVADNGTGVLEATVDVGVGVGPVVLEVGGALPGSDAITAPIACGVEVAARFLPRPVAPPLGVLSEWPLIRQAHIMDALTEANPRYTAHVDYEVDYEEAGRLHVLVGGTDVTYLRGAPVAFDDYSMSAPFGPTTARISMPQVKPWDEDGEGDLAPFAPGRDPAVEVCLVRPDDSVEQVWEGFLAVADDSSGQGREDYEFTAEGIFAQAAHQPHNPNPFMEPTDVGHVIADALNGVVNRRWSAVPRVTTGILTRNRGAQGQSVWQYVQDLLSLAWTDDERQWTLARVAPYTYRLQLKSVVTATDFTITKGAPGVSVSLSRDQSQRRDCIFGRGIDKDGGVWGNWFFPGLDRFVLPPYPMAGFASMAVGTTDADTTTGRGVTDWQRRMREIGFPVRVDGVMNSADTSWVKAVQRKRGASPDGILGPQTWAATFDPGMTDQDLTAVRLPLVALPDSEPYLYNANGSKVGHNPLHDALRVRHAMTEVDFGAGISKAEAIELAGRMLERESAAGWSGTVVLLTDPHEAGTTRFDIRPGHNVHVIGHRGGVDLQVSDVSVSGLAVTLTVDEKARDALTVDRILERNRDARRDPSGRGLGNDRSALNRSDVVQYEAESQAGTVPRAAVNGNSGLWTVLPIFVSQIGVAKVEFYATEPKAEMCIALFERPITANRLASFLPDPLADDEGWYDNVDTLRSKFGLMEVWGSASNPAGYFPRQKTGNPSGPLTGRLEERSGAIYSSKFGGFVWVAIFTSHSCWVEGTVFPAVPT